MPLVKTQAEGINLADTFAFSGTVSGAGGSRTLIRKVTISSNTASVEFIHGSNSVVLDSTYSRYEIDIDTCVPENAQQLRIYASSDGGSSYYGDSVYSCLIHRGYTNGSSTAQDIHYANDYVGGNFGSIPFASNKGGVDGKVIVTNLGTAHRTIFNCEFSYYDTSNYYIHINSIGAYESNTQTLNAIKLAMSSGNIASGTFKLFGVS
tara:strand:+ start:33 stop:653 length:621 start_codon:yes stop_codon:yes gene_type:complete